MAAFLPAKTLFESPHLQKYRFEKLFFSSRMLILHNTTNTSKSEIDVDFSIVQKLVFFEKNCNFKFLNLGGNLQLPALRSFFHNITLIFVAWRGNFIGKKCRSEPSFPTFFDFYLTFLQHHYPHFLHRGLSWQRFLCRRVCNYNMFTFVP